MRKYACEILGVPENANEEQIKTAYKRLVKQYHQTQAILRMLSIIIE